MLYHLFLLTMQLLVVEDDPLLAHYLMTSLQEMGNLVRHAANCEEARYQKDNFPFDVAIIDLGLPDGDGVELIEQWRQQQLTQPIMILTARGNWEDKVRGLNAGADDYLVKPFQLPELIARLNALLRRSDGYVSSTIKAGPLALDLLSKQATFHDQQLALTAYEYQILEYMMRHNGEVIAKQQLIDALYPDGDGEINTVEVLISRLRRKLKDPALPSAIDTVRGQGYRFMWSN